MPETSEPLSKMIQGVNTEHSVDRDLFYSSIENVTYELADDIKILVEACLEVKANPSEVLAAYCLKVAFDYALSEARTLCIAIMNKKSIEEIGLMVNDSITHNSSMANEQSSSIIDMIN